MEGRDHFDFLTTNCRMMSPPPSCISESSHVASNLNYCSENTTQFDHHWQVVYPFDVPVVALDDVIQHL